MKFKYDNDIPAEVLPTLKQHLEPLSWLVPGWCQFVHIQWGINADANKAICAWCEYDYRRATLCFYPPFLTYADFDARQLLVTHDMLHAFSGVLVEYAEDLIKRLIPESEAPKFREHALAELNMRNEGFVQDFAYAIHQREKSRSA